MSLNSLEKEGIDEIVRQKIRGKMEHSSLETAVGDFSIQHGSNEEISEHSVQIRIEEMKQYEDTFCEVLKWFESDSDVDFKEYPKIDNEDILSKNYEEALNKLSGLGELETSDRLEKEQNLILEFASNVPMHITSMEFRSLLLKMTPNILIHQNEYGETLIYRAAEKGNVVALRALLSVGSKLICEIPNKMGWNPLFIASRKGHSECQKVLLEDVWAEFPEIIKRFGSSYGSLMARLIACHRCKGSERLKEEMDLLLRAASNVPESLTMIGFKDIESRTTPGVLTASDESGESLIYKAAAERNHTAVQTFLAVCPVELHNKPDNDGWTPAAIASFYPSSKCNQLLKDKMNVQSFRTEAVYKEMKRQLKRCRRFLCIKSRENEFILLRKILELVPNKLSVEGLRALYKHMKLGFLKNANRWKMALVLFHRFTANNNVTALHALLHLCDYESAVCVYGEEKGSAFHTAVQESNSRCIRVLTRRCRHESTFSRLDSCKRSPLFLAAEMGRIECLQVLIESLSTVSSPQNECYVEISSETDERGRTPLLVAVEKNHVECVHMLIKAFPVKSHCITDKRGRTPLLMAVEMNHVECVRMLIKASHATIHCVTDSRGRTPLLAAVEMNHVECVRMLVKASPATIHCVTDSRGRTPLLVAVERNHAECIRMLAKASPAKSHCIADKVGGTPLLVAVKKNNVECVHMLIKASPVKSHCTIDKQNKWASLLTNAFHHNSLEVAKLLLDISSPQDREQVNWLLHEAVANCSLDWLKLLLFGSRQKFREQVNEEGNTALHIAMEGGNTDIQTTLLDNSDIGYCEIVNKEGDTALHIGARNWCSCEVLVALLNKSQPGYREVADKKGNTALHLVTKNKNYELGRALLHNSRPGYREIVNKKGNTVLHIAAKFKGNREFLADLLHESHPGYREKVNNDGDTALHIAAQYSRHKVEILLKGSSIKYRERVNKRGETALHKAAKSKIFDMLVEGSRPHYCKMRDKGGFTAEKPEDAHSSSWGWGYSGCPDWYVRGCRDDSA
eukprot:TRINITY_DN3093_c0_g1_i2.p1 TRINITY_DN3093_c0_g1~~TRINITY_DN3093_c0_g1_i2.p1  ORF type:complete len:1025 (-),score=146.73 TRINITY_DN3093_c0_g1_i2:261-3335(-)